MSEDFIEAAKQNGQSIKVAIQSAYRIIACELNKKTEGKKFQYWVKSFQFENNLYENKENQNISNADETVGQGEKMFSLLTEKQAEIANANFYAANNTNIEMKCFSLMIYVAL